MKKAKSSHICTEFYSFLVSELHISMLGHPMIDRIKIIPGSTIALLWLSWIRFGVRWAWMPVRSFVLPDHMCWIRRLHREGVWTDGVRDCPRIEQALLNHIPEHLTINWHFYLFIYIYIVSIRITHQSIINDVYCIIWYIPELIGLKKDPESLDNSRQQTTTLLYMVCQ